MNAEPSIQLNNIDPEDISDVLKKVEHSFQFEFSQEELAIVKTFGDLCELVIQKTSGTSSDTCTTQEAFYKLRTAILSSSIHQKQEITPSSQLNEVFHKSTRITEVKKIQESLGTELRLLDIPKWQSWLVFFLFLLGIGLFWVNWAWAIAGLFFAGSLSWFLNRYSATEFILKTVGDWADKMSKEEYRASRRDPSTINSKEINQKLRVLFMEELGLEESALRSEAKF